MTFFEFTIAVYKLLHDNRIEKQGLLDISDEIITTPYFRNIQSIYKDLSVQDYKVLDLKIIGKLITRLRESKKYKGLNHVGFCYKVDSKKIEIKKIISEISKTKFNVFQEPSIDDGDWIFVGDISNISSPMLEFIPHEGKTKDIWIDYWLPHIHFDIDTKLTASEITDIVKEFIIDPTIPYSIEIKHVIYTQRVRLGCIDGINIFIDISTNNRDINYRGSWEKLH